MKKIEFKSTINNQGKVSEIKFQNRVEILEYNNFLIFEFDDPKQNVKNRIEISEVMVNIFSGASSLNLELNKKIRIEYQTGSGIIILESFLHSVDLNDKNNIIINYSLFNASSIEVGKYKIELKIS
jgi:hypothetical protein